MKLAVFCVTIFFYHSICFGQILGGELFQLRGTDTYVSGVKKEQFQNFQAEQEYDNWCWAASIKMVLNYQGINVEQADIVRQAYGAVVNRPASCDVMVRAANNWSKGGKMLRAYEENDLSPKNIIDILAKKYPLVVGLRMPGQNVGHAYVLTAVYFTQVNGKMIPGKVVLRDPWPDNPNRYTTTWEDLISRKNCFVHFTFD